MADEQTLSGLTPQEQLQDAAKRLELLNRTLPAPIALPPHTDLACGQDALVALLIEKNIITEDEFVERKTLRLAEVLNEVVDQLHEARRNASGLIIAGPNPSI